jgi:predicted DNA-binding antitoxin AbrB/MazE fold protein
MSEQIDAIYDNGVLKPVMPLALPDKARVKLTIDAASVSEPAEKIAGQKGVEREKGAAEGDTADRDFDRELDALLFEGPSLPADFSRADIYADHD